MLTRDQWKDRLIKAQIPEEVVTDLLKLVSDEDLVRMKDMSNDEILQAMRDAAAAEDSTPPAADPSATPPTDPTGVSDPAADDDALDVAAILKSFGESVTTRTVEQVKDLLENHQFSLESPQLTEILKDVQELKEQYVVITENFKSLKDMWEVMFKDDTNRLQELFANMSPAQRTRIRSSLPAAASVAHVKDVLGDAPPPMAPNTTVFQPIVRDASGREYETLGHMARGEYKK